MASPRALVCILAAATALAPRPASAYCRASTCEPSGTRCTPEQPDDCGVAIKWNRPCVGVSVQKDASKKISLYDARTALHRAFVTWQSAKCPKGGTPGILIEDLGAVDCDQVEYNGKAGNANVVIFRDTKWPHPQGPHNIALTTVTYDTNTGEIFDADMEINTAQYNLTMKDTTADYDMQSVFTHEAGHFLGLAHSPDATATMYSVYTPGSTAFRSLAADDEAAICAVYAPAAVDADHCNPLPRHGFSPACADKQTEGSCALSAAPRRAGGGTLVVACALGAACALRRRGRVRRR
jgi:hypothetical protein